MTDETPPALNDFGQYLDTTVQAKAAALVELNSDTLVYGMNLDEKVYPASLTKIMTCMLALEHGNLDDIVTVSHEALQDLNAAGSSAGLLEGEQLSLRELLYCVMISSANEACNVVAEYIAGDIPSFVALMNAQAAALGMTGTHFANAHGLHDENHYTTVRDLVTLARWAWQSEQFQEFSTQTSHTVPATNKSEERVLRTTNYLTSGQTVGKYYYDKARGIKTGFTTPAGGCLISTAESGSLHFLSVVCGCETLQNDDGTETAQCDHGCGLTDTRTKVGSKLIDEAAPAVEGVADGGTYCLTAEIAVTDPNLESVTLNGQPVELVDGKLTVSAAEGVQTLTATDRFGNTVTVTFTVNAQHTEGEGEITTPATTEREGVKTYACTVCGQVLRTESVTKLPAPAEPTTPAVPTGDTGDTGLWMGLAALCGMSLAALLRTGKRKEQ